MVLHVVVCALAAAGVLLIVWCVVGHMLLPVARSLVSVYVLRGGDQELEKTLRAFEWLCESNLMAGTLLVVDCACEHELHELAAALCGRSSCARLCKADEVNELLKLES